MDSKVDTRIILAIAGEQVDFDRKLYQLAQLILRARVFLDIWLVYESAETKPLYLNSIKRHSEFFQFDIQAHLVALVMYLALICEKRTDTLNLQDLVGEARQSGVDAASIAKSEAALGRAEDICKKVKILRNKLFAHRDLKLSYKEVFRKADITPGELRELTELGLQVVNLMGEARGKAMWQFSLLPTKDITKLLEVLNEVYEKS